MLLQNTSLAEPALDDDSYRWYYRLLRLDSHMQSRKQRKNGSKWCWLKHVVSLVSATAVLRNGSVGPQFSVADDQGPGGGRVTHPYLLSSVGLQANKSSCKKAAAQA